MSAVPSPLPAGKLTPQQWDAEEVKAAVLPHLESIVRQWGVRMTGKVSASGYLEAHAIDREDFEPSAGVCTQTGVYRDLGGSGQVLSIFELAIALGIYPDFNAAVNALGERLFVQPRVGPFSVVRPNGT